MSEPATPTTTIPTTTTPTTTTGDALGWSSATWDALIQAVHQETRRTKIAQKILPLHGPLPDAMNVPSDITVGANDLRITEGASTILTEVSVQFAMTKTQVQQEQEMSTALTLATRAANLIATGEDHIIFQGSIQNLPQDLRNLIRARNDNNVNGLVGVGNQAEQVQPIQNNPLRYGENTFRAVADGISYLQGQGHYGPYALILHTDMYADTHAPLQGTLIMPADRIRPLVEKGFYGTGALPERRGVLLSLGGNTMDLTVGIDATPEFMFVDNDGMYRFRAFERFALRLKNNRAVRRLEFQEP
jgi:uncharacterized linocin/CFP29 family protein